MRFSQKFKSSSHCLPSPDGQLVATLLPTEIHIRSIEDLGAIAHVVELPRDLNHGGILNFQWSPSSTRLLIATPDLILVVSALPEEEEEEDDDDERPSQPFSATIRNPALSTVGRPAFVGFGPVDDQVCLCSAFGLKFSVFDLRTAKTVEIANPKLYSPAICSRGFSFRLNSHHLALLTRTAGKDWISVHQPSSGLLVASWAPDTIDAQGLLWSPDGRWLAVWESAAHGHKILFYTPDGHLFKPWTGSRLDRMTASRPHGEEDAQETAESVLGPGVKIAQFSSNGKFLAVGDASRCVHILDTTAIVEIRQLVHPTTLNPHAHPLLKVWQEQISPGIVGSSTDAVHTFIEASQAVLPPDRTTPLSSDAAALATGCSLLAFDSSTNLLATRLEESPSTVWIWDSTTSELCAVLMFHANVSGVMWHSGAHQTLLVTCDGDQYRGLGFVWRGLAGPPEAADLGRYLLLQSAAAPPGGQLPAKPRPMWLDARGIPQTLFYSNGWEFAFATLDALDTMDSMDTMDALDEDGSALSTRSVPWPLASANVVSQFIAVSGWAAGERRREESPLELVPAGKSSGEDSELEDTFHYKRED